MRINHISAVLAGALLIGTTPIWAEDWDALFRDLTSTDSKVSEAARTRTFTMVLPSLYERDAQYVEGELDGILKHFNSNENIKLQASGFVAMISVVRPDGSHVLGKAIPVLIERLRDTTPRIRANAAYALANLKPVIPPAAAAALLEACHHSDPQVVRMSTYGVARLAATGSSEATEALASLLSSKHDNQVKGAVLESIRATGVKAPGLVPGVSALLSPDTDPQLAMSALGVIRSFRTGRGQVPPEPASRSRSCYIEQGSGRNCSHNAARRNPVMTLSAVRPTIKSSRLRGIAKALLGAVIAFVLFNLSCAQCRQVEKEMVWSCRSPEDVPAPGIQPFGRLTLELRFQENPGYAQFMNGPTAEKLCQELPKSNKKTLRVLFEVTGSDFYGVKGHRIESIGGQKYVHQSGDGGSWAAINTAEPSPFSSTFRRYFRKTK